jgi:tetratricopeptide (TPR) repeat protein
MAMAIVFQEAPSKIRSMTSPSLPSKRSEYWWRWGWAIALGIPLTTATLFLTQPTFLTRLDTLRYEAFNPLEPEFRYPFPESLKGDRSPISAVQREIAFYLERLRNQPNSAVNSAALATAYLRMARLNGQGNWYLLANQSAQKSLAILPINNTEALLVQARLAEAQHDFEAALRLVKPLDGQKEAIALQVTTNLAMGRLAAADRAAQQSVDQNLSLSAFTLLALVKSAQGRDQEALQNFRYALDVEEPGEFSHSARTRTLMGRFFYERGQLDTAEGFYREALRILPDYPLAQVNLAQLAIRRGDDWGAERIYQQVVDQSDGNPTVYDPLILRGRARIQQLRGNLTAANQLWDEAETLLRQSFIGSTSTSFGHRRDLAKLLLERSAANPETARPWIQEAITLMETELQLRRDAETLETYAWALSQDHRWRDAQKAVQEAIALGTRTATLYDHAATIEQSLGNLNQAQTYHQIAQEIDPQFGNPARSAANLSAGLGS